MAFDSTETRLFRLKSHTLDLPADRGQLPELQRRDPVQQPESRCGWTASSWSTASSRVAVCSNPIDEPDPAWTSTDNRITLTAQGTWTSRCRPNEIDLACELRRSRPSRSASSRRSSSRSWRTWTRPTVVVELADSTRAGVFKPVYDDNAGRATTLMLLMPMMINA